MKEQYSQSTQEQEVQPKYIGWLGPDGTFTKRAAEIWRTKSGDETVNLASDFSQNIAAIFKGVLDGSLDCGVVPIENTIGGPVRDTHAALEELDGITIIGEVVLPIQQYFFCQNPSLVTAIASKDQALAQVKKWIEANYPQAKKLEVSSTALAVQMAAEDKTIGAIAGADTAVDLGLGDKLKRTEESVEDNKANTTTFVAIAKNAGALEPTGNDKTTLILELPNRAGSLYSVLTDLSERGINLTKIKSLKSVDGKIRFLISVDGHQQEEKIGSALSRLTDKEAKLKTLGSYPKDNYIPEHKVEPNMGNAIAMIEKETKNGDANNKDSAVIVFNLPNQVGALAKVLKIFAERNINLTKIDSMPSGNFEEYIFYLSFNINDVKDQDNLFKELADRSKNIVQLLQKAKNN